MRVVSDLPRQLDASRSTETRERAEAARRALGGALATGESGRDAELALGEGSGRESGGRFSRGVKRHRGVAQSTRDRDLTGARSDGIMETRNDEERTL